MNQQQNGVFNSLSRTQKTWLFFAGCVPLRLAIAIAAFHASRNLIMGFSAAMFVGIVLQMVRAPDVWWNRQLWASFVLFIFSCALFVRDDNLMSFLVAATLIMHVAFGVIGFISHYY